MDFGSFSTNPSIFYLWDRFVRINKPHRTPSYNRQYKRKAGTLLDKQYMKEEEETAWDGNQLTKIWMGIMKFTKTPTPSAFWASFSIMRGHTWKINVMAKNDFLILNSLTYTHLKVFFLGEQHLSWRVILCRSCQLLVVSPWELSSLHTFFPFFSFLH